MDLRLVQLSKYRAEAEGVIIDTLRNIFIFPSAHPGHTSTLCGDYAGLRHGWAGGLCAQVGGVPADVVHTGADVAPQGGLLSLILSPCIWHQDHKQNRK